VPPDSSSAAAAPAPAPAPAAASTEHGSLSSSRRGRFLVLEGIDGCGKTTQLEALADWLPGSGLLPPGARLIRTREPGATPLGQALRQLLLHADDAQAPCPSAELLLYAADRAQHVQTVILPALAAGHWVLSDRFTGSTAAYQGHGRGLDADLIAELETIATGGLQPDLTLWLDLPLEQSLARRSQRPADRIEAAGTAFLARVAAGFAIEAQRRAWTRIDADAAPDLVSGACRRALQQAPSLQPQAGCG
jgi:dTMP kinase